MKPKQTRAGQKIIAAFKTEAAAHARGLPRTIRTIELPEEPGKYSPNQIAAVRARLGVSQAVFAKLLGVSTVRVAHVEQGRRGPNLMMRRMLDLIARAPAPWQALVKPKAEPARRASA